MRPALVCSLQVASLRVTWLIQAVSAATRQYPEWTLPDSIGGQGFQTVIWRQSSGMSVHLNSGTACMVMYTG